MKSAIRPRPRQRLINRQTRCSHSWNHSDFLCGAIRLANLCLRASPIQTPHESVRYIISDEMGSWGWHKCRQFLDHLQRLKDDVRGSISPGTLEWMSLKTGPDLNSYKCTIPRSSQCVCIRSDSNSRCSSVIRMMKSPGSMPAIAT